MKVGDLALLICVISGIIYIFIPPKHWTAQRVIDLAKVSFAIGLFVYLFGGK